MSNGPPGDVEILLPRNQESGSDQRENIRLRLHRGKHTLEVSRHISKDGMSKDVGEWTKKVLLLGNSLQLSEEDLFVLDGSERTALARLGGFLRICDVAEGAEVDSGFPAADKLGPGEDGRLRLERVLRHWENEVAPEADVRLEKPPHSSQSVVSSVILPPRPRKFLSGAMLR